MTFPRFSFGGWTDRGFQQAEGLYVLKRMNAE